ncbi:OLC1v1009369C1 [Oldenlandia corymbosa var. corymbosa]|uniref:OLC1v1009369C1 n=1 Tax=Oldenlandia corymbosa var. corymbosa TaxID=529605 RepID=A0AAV1DPC1_OLDCO|nr:OLC1v1009369C1 [Oldenlandia corymbosa var. corymbosa]
MNPVKPEEDYSGFHYSSTRNLNSKVGSSSYPFPRPDPVVVLHDYPGSYCPSGINPNWNSGSSSYSSRQNSSCFSSGLNTVKQEDYPGSYNYSSSTNQNGHSRRPQSGGTKKSFSGDGKPGSSKSGAGDSDGESRKADDRALFKEALKDLNQPTTEIDVPEGILSVPLIRHQKIALAWMMEKEKGHGICIGGILADDQGLGKTVSMIALIQMHRPLQQTHKTEKKVPAAVVKPPEGLILVDEDTAPGAVKTEQFVKLEVKSENVEEVPSVNTGVLRQWARELDEKVAEESKLSVLVYHGSKRTLDPFELAKYDVVLTTYAFVSMEVRKQPVPDNKKKKNHRVKVARACFSLRANTRWLLSGTALQNEIKELYSYFRFLRHDPYSNFIKFVKGFQKPKCGGSGYQRIRMVLKPIMLRRTKETLIDGTVEDNWSIILLMVLRLRQACDHPMLVKNSYKKIVSRDALKTGLTLPKEKRQSLLEVLKSPFAVCGLCGDPTPELVVVTICGHVYCFECVINHLTEVESITCPDAGCNEDIGMDSIFTEEILKECLSDDIDDDSSSSPSNDEEVLIIPKNQSSSKINAALQVLKSCCKVPSISSPQENESQISNPAKTIVFSQWTSILDLVEEELRRTNLKYRRLDGTMSLIARDLAVKDFNTNPEVVVILLSLKAGNLGLNMVAANHVILLDPWWNPTTEDQAVDRAHRIGQTSPVTVTRLISQQTIEDRVLMLQHKKRKLVSDVIGEDPRQGSASALTVNDLKMLFNVR